MPCPVVVTFHDPSATLKEIADLIYYVAMHPVRSHEGYLAGTAEDANRHKPR